VIIHGDCTEVLPTLEEQSVDLIFADPPYFLSPPGRSARGQSKSILKDKGGWDRPLPPLEMHQFNCAWINACTRVLRPGGSLWACGTFHNIYSIGWAIQWTAMGTGEPKLQVLNDVSWLKGNPPPNLGCRSLTHAHESLVWAVRQGSDHTFNYGDLRRGVGCGRQLKDVWEIGPARKGETIHGKHPTQKPEALLERIILACTKPGDLVLDPFAGSGTTCAVAKRLGRKWIGIEKEHRWFESAWHRVKAVQGVQMDLLETGR